MGMHLARAGSGEDVSELVPTTLTSGETQRICREVAEKLSNNIRVVQDRDPA